jgi:hypothetical protein
VISVALLFESDAPVVKDGFPIKGMQGQTCGWNHESNERIFYVSDWLDEAFSSKAAFTWAAAKGFGEIGSSFASKEGDASDQQG